MPPDRICPPSWASTCTAASSVLGLEYKLAPHAIVQRDGRDSGMTELADHGKTCSAGGSPAVSRASGPRRWGRDASTTAAGPAALRKIRRLRQGYELTQAGEEIGILVRWE